MIRADKLYSLTIRLLLAAACAALSLVSGAAGVTIDAVSSAGGNGPTMTVSHTVSGSDRLLLVGVYLDGLSSVSGVTWNGEALARAAYKAPLLGSPRVELWYCVAPSEGTSDVEVTLFLSATTNMAVNVMSLVGVDQDDPIYSTASDEGINGDPMVVASSRAGDLVLDFLASTSTGVPTVGSNQTVAFSELMGSSSHYGASSWEAGQNAVEMRWNLDGVLPQWVLLAVSIAPSCYTYYISPTGNNGQDGTSPATAWSSINNGESRGVMGPGDTVNILPGAYNITSTLELSTGGTSERGIVYRAYGGDATVNGGGGTFDAFLLSGDYTTLDGVTVTNTTGKGVVVSASHVSITNCFVQSVGGDDGFYLDGDYALLYRNIVSGVAGYGVNIRLAATQALIYHNVIYNGAQAGVEIQTSGTTARIFNNIIVQNLKGISASSAGNIIAFNDVYDNNSGNYMSAAVDSAGGISVEPWFVDPAGGDFTLQTGSQCIDAGLDLGYEFRGAAPDMGAFEIESNYLPTLDPIGARTTTEHVMLTFGVTASDPESTPELSTSTRPSGATFTDHGNGTGTFEWTPGYPTAGEHTLTFYAVDDSLAVDSEQVTITVDPAVLDHLTVTPDLAGVSADTGRQFFVAGYDASGNPADSGSITWSLTVDLGTMDAGGWFDATTAGASKVIATSDLGPVDTTTLLLVNEGVLSSMELLAVSYTVSADSTRQFSVWGADADGNAVTDFGTVSWSVVGDIGTIDSSGLFTATTAGYGQIRATSSLGPSALSDSVQVVPGAMFRYRVVPDVDVVEEGDSLPFTASGYDSDDNLTADLTDVTTWSTTDPTGSITTQGLYTAGNSISPPDYHVKGEYNSFADSSVVTVISNGQMSYLRVEYADGSEALDTNLTTDNDTTLYRCYAYDSGNNPIGAVDVDWSLIGDDIGTLIDEADGEVRIALTTPGSARLAARHTGGLADTSGIVTVTGGAPDHLQLAPNNLTISADSAVMFTCESLDADDNPSTPLVVPVFSVFGGIGEIDSLSGEFSPHTVGTGYVVATGGGLADTTGAIKVVAGALQGISVEPDSVIVGIGDLVQFTVAGHDASGNESSAGDISWKLLGRTGYIDAGGLFTATRAGLARVAATSDAGVADTTDILAVEEVVLTTIPVGNNTVAPGAATSSLLSFGLDNFFDDTKTVTGLDIYLNITGPGLPAQRLTNVDSVMLYLDADHDSLLTGVDQLLASSEVGDDPIQMSITPLTIAARSGKVFFIGAAASSAPRDGDTLDVYLYPSTGITLEDATVVAGPDSANSYGRTIVNGMVASQLTVTANGSVTVAPGDDPAAVLTLDVPRNGYASDIMTGLSITSVGSAVASDFAALTLLRDDGNGSYDGQDDETFVGHLVFTGDRWTLSGLNAPLNNPTTRFYVTAEVSSYPISGHQFIANLPVNGITVQSGNDGPYDDALVGYDTITIQTAEAVTATAYQLTARTLIPGELSEPLLALSIMNDYGASVGVDSLRVGLTWTAGTPAPAAILDSQFDSLLLYLDGGAYDALDAADQLIGTAQLSNGEVLFELAGVDVPQQGGEIDLVVVAAVSAHARNGNKAGLAVNDGGLYFDQVVSLEAVFPLANTAVHTIDVFPASLVTVHALSSFDMQAGGLNQVLLDFTLPGNGYAADSLSSLSVANLGTVADVVALQAVRLWADAANDGFDGDETLVGLMSLELGSWGIRNLKYPIPVGGRRFIVTADISATQFESGTLRLSIPVDGCRYRSSADGPDDMAIQSAGEIRLYPANRITAISIPRGSGSVTPGSSGSNLLTFALYNGYGSTAQILQGLTINNGTHSGSSDDFADHELGQVSLLFDADQNRTLENDSLVASGYFTDGALHFSGIDIALPADSLSYFFVVADVPMNLIDGDSLAALIEAPSSFTFSQPVVINGDMPLSAGGYLVANGSVAEQYGTVHLASGTLSPGDVAAPLFAFVPAVNGDLTDYLQGLMITNAGDADTSDLSALYLWQDADGDDVWQATDVALGTFSYSGSQWLINGLDLAIAPDPATLFVTGDVAIGATPGATFRATIPINGCTYVSANDGPLDRPLIGDNQFAVSSSGLGISYTPLADAYTIGQAIVVNFTATNRLGTMLTAVTGAVVDCTDPSIVTADSAHGGPVDLDPGESFQFAAFYTAHDVGPVAFSVQAVATVDADTSALLTTNSTDLQSLPGEVPLQMISSIPTAVTRGQANVFPLSLSYSHPDSDSATAAIRLDSLRLDVLDGSGQPLQAASLFSRMVLSTGYTELTVLDVPPSQSAVWMVFEQPLIVYPGGSRKLSLLVDIDSTTTAQGFSLSLPGASAIEFVDANSLQAVAIDPAVTFPLSTPLCRVEDRSQQMAVSYVSLIGPTVNRGQDFVDVLQLNLRHPGDAGSSQIQLTNLSFRLLDDAGSPLPVSELLEYARLMKRQIVIAEVDCSDVDTSDIDMQLNSPVSLNPGEIDSIRIALSLKGLTEEEGFSLYIEDSLSFTVRELSSGSSLDAATDTDRWATGSVFPMESATAELKLPASDLVLCLEAPLPTSTVSGRDSLELFTLDCHYPVTTEFSSISLQRLLVSVMDSTGAPINPVELFDRIGVVDPNGVLTYQMFISLEGGAAVFNIGTDGWTIAPGDSVELRLVGDIANGTEIDNFALVLETPAAIDLVDATDTTQHPAILTPPPCDFVYPYVSTVTNVYQPAGRPGLVTSDGAVVIAPKGGRGITLYTTTLNYDSPLPQGAVELSALHGRLYKRTTSGLTPVRENQIFSSLSLTIDGDSVASDADLGDDTLAPALDVPLLIEHGETPSLGLTVDINPSAALGNYVVRFDDSTFLSMADRNLATAIYPSLSGGYPLLSSELSIVPDGLEASFTNYPNPFIPSERPTTIGFVLTNDAHVDIELFTITGDLVKTIVVNDFRSAGVHQSDTWDGRNEGGRDVAPGTYYCRITAHYSSGGSESFRRKVAVLR